MGDGEGRGKKTPGPGSGRGRQGGKYKLINDGQKLPRSVKVGPGGAGGGRKNNKVANLDELDMLHKEAISQIEHCNETSQLPSGNTYEWQWTMDYFYLSHFAFKQSFKKYFLSTQVKIVRKF